MPNRTVVAAEVLLILPASLFMTALVVRDLQPAGAAPGAAAVVDWFAARPQVGLWGLLITLPFVALVTGCATLFRSWNADLQLRDAVRRMLLAARARVGTLVVAVTTLTAAAVLAIVAVHVLAN
jgi:hypothetical protein